MSAKATFWAWHQPIKPATAKLVLLCLADCHNGDHGQCNPGVEYIARMTGLNRKTVLSSLATLEKLGEVSIVKGAGKSNHYTLRTSTEIGTSTENGTSTEIGTTPVPKTVLVPVPKTVPEPKREPKKNLSVEIYGSLADRMWDRIQPLTKQKKYSREAWANDLRKIVEIDGVSEDDVWAAFVWANENDFWAANVLSPGKLREKIPTINAQRARTKPTSEAMAWR